MIQATYSYSEWSGCDCDVRRLTRVTSPEGRILSCECAVFVLLPHTAQSSHCCSDHLRPTDGVSQPSRVQPVAVSCNDLAVPTQLTTDDRLNPRWWRNSRVTLLSLILLYFYGQISVIKGVYIISYIIPHCKVEKIFPS